MRIDKLLWHLRLARTRGAAQALVGSGQIRRNGQRVMRLAQPVVCGDVLTVPVPSGVAVIEVTALPERRGPASAMAACYRVLDEGCANPIAADHRDTP